ncbi:MAG: PA14 domain-containing protein [Chloroflexota bacterium]
MPQRLYYILSLAIFGIVFLPLVAFGQTPKPSHSVVSAQEPGLRYTYYEGVWDRLPDFDSLSPDKTGTVNTFDLTSRMRDDTFAFRFEGYIDIATNGTYTFTTVSDDGSQLFIDNQLVINNDGLHAAQERSETIELSSGKYPIVATFFEKYGQERFQVLYAGPGIETQPIPDTVLSHEQKTASVLPAFPGAEGFGTQTTHGRGGQVIAVTNLNNDGPGSLREAIDTPGPRIIVFRTGGCIQLDEALVIQEPYVMIAGQTAPGGGICLKGSGLSIATHDVVVRFVRSRPGDGPGEDPENRDALQIAPFLSNNEVRESYNVVVDHVSASWGIDETVSVYGSLDPASDIKATDITIQWSVIAEGLDDSLHPKGSHSKGVLIGGGAQNISLHHNIIAHNAERHPLFKTGTTGDLVNNVIYNGPWGISLVNEDATQINPSGLNLIGNTMIEGPDSTDKTYGLNLDGNYLTEPAAFFVQGNKSPQRQDDGQGEWDFVRTVDLDIDTYRANSPVLQAPPVTTWPADEARETVLDAAGATLPQRDAVDTRIIDDVRNGTGRIIDSPEDVGGYPSYPAGTAPVDSDADGMPDSWEEEHDLNADDPSDGTADRDGDGYTNVEEYLNSLVPDSAYGQ